MDLAAAIAFAATFLVFAASPGPDNLTIVARTISRGASSGLAYGAGTVTGILAFLAAACLGLAVLTSQMSGMMTALRYAGSAYLVVMGLRLWFSPTIAGVEHPQASRGGLVAGYLAGLVLNLGNPKMPLFYLALLPNFIGTALSLRQALEMAAIIVVVEAVVIGGHVLLARRARGVLRRPANLRHLNRGAGMVMVGAGLAAAAR